MKLIINLFLLLILNNSIAIGEVHVSERIKICEAIEIVVLKLNKESSDGITSARLIDLDDGRRVWNVQYGTEMAVSETDPSVSYQIFKYVLVHMDGSSELAEKKGIPRKRVVFPNR